MSKQLRQAILPGLMAFLVISCVKERSSIPELMTPTDVYLDQTYENLKTVKTQLERNSARMSSAQQAEQLQYLRKLEEKAYAKRTARSLGSRNSEALAEAMDGHTKIYPFEGKYRILVIPVQFQDKKFDNPAFFETDAMGKSQAQNYLFGNDEKTLTSYYKHASFGKLKLHGVVAPIVTVDENLVYYGEAISGSSDARARQLVIDSLRKLKGQQTDPAWWDQFDHWDLNDYDRDSHFHEPDGFIDAVVLIYAGKSQASCQRSFDPDGSRPASVDVPEGPQHDSAVECFNRIWPHRWSIAVSEDDPEYTEQGPTVEGQSRPSMNGLKIHDGLFALDYNMQSEYSDRSTFMHEFGHSLSLPDVYSSGRSNSTGNWELMSSNARLQAQEFSSFSKVSLGWLKPKIVRQGEKTSAYLGHYNFVSPLQRDRPELYQGPAMHNGADGVESIVSHVPGFGEPVYRSIAVLTNPSRVTVPVFTPNEISGDSSVYSGRFDGASRSFKTTLKVPDVGNAVLSFDTLYHIETETNFWSSSLNDLAVKVTVDYDLGKILINGKKVEEIRTISGDTDFDTLAEENKNCEAHRVLELRERRIRGSITPTEKQELLEKAKVCQQPVWTQKSYDLSHLRGKEVELEVALVTDAGYTEMGIVLDNIRLGDELIDFEYNLPDPGDWTFLRDGSYEEFHNQYYLFEYRDPLVDYSLLGKQVSYNMDANINNNTQSMFMGAGTALDRFRLITQDYQPGVLVWYYNSRFGRNSNDATAQGGKGYLLVLNSKVKEVPLPGILGDASLFDRDGRYNPLSVDYVQLVRSQRAEFTCFGYTEYSLYLNGVEPECGAFPYKDYLGNLKFDGKNLIYRRENFNEVLPIHQYTNFGVGVPMSRDAYSRTGLSTFRAQTAGAFSPFKVYRASYDRMVLDKELTKEAKSFAPISSFSDAENALSEVAEFAGDSVVVEKKGFEFEVFEPAERVLEQYKLHKYPSKNSHFFRRPRAKLYFNWK